MVRFIYSPLNSAQKEIRLISLLLPGLFDTDIKVEIFHEKLSVQYQPDYEALSYVCGSTEYPDTISIAYRNQHGDRTNPGSVGGSAAAGVSEPFSRGTDHPIYETLSVTQNLSTALRYLRKPATNRVIWIDAICINQDDIPERSLEVARMGFIYNKARQVIVWLGPNTENSELAIETLHSLARDIIYDHKLHRLDVVYNSPTFRIEDDSDALVAREWEWKSIQDLIYRKWFTRLWIYQEIILSRVAVVTVGLSELPWNSFRSALWWIFIQSARLPSLSAVFDYEYIDNYVKPILKSTAIDIDIIGFLQFSKYASCTDPKDRIYSMFNLTSLGVLQQKLGIIPDYSKTKEQIYYDFVQRCIVTLGTLNMLKLCNLQNSSPNLPSWVSDLSGINYKAPLNGINASGPSKACAYFSAAGNCLHLLGVAGGTINFVGQSIPDKASLSETLAICRTWDPPNLGGVYNGGGSMLDAFVKTLFCGNIREDHPLTAGNIPTLEEGRDFALSFLRDLRIAKSDNVFLYAIRRMLRGRNFCAASNSLVSAFPYPSRIGDQIFVALGCKTPLLLRPLPDQKGTYRLVGDCYVAGLMDGEALLGPLPGLWKFGYINKDFN